MGTNFAAAAVFYKRGNSRAGHAALALGGSVLVTALMIDYEYGVFRRWSLKTHGILDYEVAAASVAFPKLLDLDEGADAAYFYPQDGGESLIVGISDYTDNAELKRELGSTHRSRRAA